MGWIQKSKDSLDWGKRLEFLVKVIGLVWTWFVGESMKAIVESFTHIPRLWHLPIYLFASFLALLLFVVVAHRIGQDKNVSTKTADQMIRDVKKSAAMGVILSFMHARATELQAQLEALWHHWDNAGEKLIHPIDGTLDMLKDFSREGAMDLLNERRHFLVLYAHHLRTLEAELPDFTSDIVASGFPANSEYFQVRLDLGTHIDKLKALSDEEWNKY